MNEKKTIAVVFGGCSPEYNVSLESAAGVLTHLDRDRFTPVPVGTRSRVIGSSFPAILRKYHATLGWPGAPAPQRASARTAATMRCWFLTRQGAAHPAGRRPAHFARAKR